MQRKRYAIKASFLKAMAAIVSFTLAALAPIALFGCAQEQTLPGEATIGTVSLRYPDTVEPAGSEPSSSTVTTANSLSYKQKSLSFQNAERTFAFDVRLCEGVSYDDALDYAKTAPDEAAGGESSEHETVLFEKYGIGPSDLTAATFETPETTEVDGRASFTQLSTAGDDEAKAVHFVQCIDARDGSIVYLDAILPEQTFLENEDVLRAIGQSIRIEETTQG